MLSYLPDKIFDYDECVYMEELKSTIVAIRKRAKETNEPYEITKEKLDAVRNHDRSTGNVTTYVGEHGTYYILIKFY